ncbi:glycosyltransferase family 2 protein [Pseudonocardia sp.]|uniref:glycosyltransferase family 2 protein n=1 Tax=Pseudonocardia sp. TaxID=60912 RepID=UPI003D14A950
MPEQAPGTAALGMVVNYYWNSPDATGKALLARTTELGLRLLRRNRRVGTIVLVDGSPTPDSELAATCEEIGARYHHAGRELGLAEGYNTGWRLLPEPFVGIMANDILPHPISALDALLDMAERDDVGCAFPYLSVGDYVTQIVRSSVLRPTMVTCEPASMTLNLNIFRRAVLEQVGGVDEGYVAGYYDPIMVLKIRELGYRVVLVGGATAMHVHALTKAEGGSTLGLAKLALDAERFRREYPEHHAEHGVWNVRFAERPFATTRPARMLWWLSENAPFWPVRRVLRHVGYTFEPLLTRYPARFGTGPGRAASGSAGGPAREAALRR